MASHFAPQDDPARSTSRGSSYSRSNASSYAAARRGGDPRGRHTGRTIAVVVGVVLAVLLVAGGTAGFLLYRSAMTVKAQASEIMAQTSSLADSLKSGDADALSSSVDTIVEKTASIDAEVHTPLWNLATFVPVVGEDIRSVQTLGDAASDLVSGALVPVTRSISGMKLSDLLQDGTVNVELVRALSASLSDATPVIKSSADTIAGLPEAHVPQLADILTKIQDPLSKAQDTIDKVQPILDVLPQMLGADGQTRTYLIIAQNNAELRSTGGLPGSWGTLTVTNGKISMGDDFQTILHGDGLKVSITEDERTAIATNMDTDPAQVNCTPDFTRVGELSREYWEQAGYGTVDGVIAVDPVFLQSLLSLTGGFEAPDGTTVDGTNAAKVLLSDTYWKFGNDGAAQDAYFSSVAALSFQNVMDNMGTADMKDLWKTVEQAGDQGRLQVWMAADDEERVMGTLGLSGALASDPAAPVLGVYLNDDTYSKISWYASCKTQIGDGTKNDDGTTTYEVTTTLTNTISPQDALNAPRYITGGNDDKRDASDMLNFVFFFAPAGGAISDMSVSEGALFEDYGIANASLSGLQVLRTRTHLKSGESATFTYKIAVSSDATDSLTLRTTPLAQGGLM